eukprot:384212-Amphidinium_carterae.1
MCNHQNSGYVQALRAAELDISQHVALAWGQLTAPVLARLELDHPSRGELGAHVALAWGQLTAPVLARLELDRPSMGELGAHGSLDQS